MKTLDQCELAFVNGGVSKNNQALQTALTNITTSIKDVAGNQNKDQNSLLLPLIMIMALGNKQQGPTVIAGAAPAPAFGGFGGFGGGPVVNVSTRIRRW